MGSRSLPAFQSPIILRDGFKCDLLAFSGTYGGEYCEMRLLRVGPDPSSNVAAAERFMCRNGFESSRKVSGSSRIEASFCPDIVVVDCPAADVLRTLPLSLERNHGLFPQWDILLRFADCSAADGASRKAGIPATSFPDDVAPFSYSHLRRRVDFISCRGAYIEMSYMLEAALGRAVGSMKGEALGRKVDRALKLPDIPGLMADSLRFLNKMRNCMAHPSDAGAVKKMAKAHSAAVPTLKAAGYTLDREYAGHVSLPRPGTIQQLHDMTKFTLILAHAVAEWLDAAPGPQAT